MPTKFYNDHQRQLYHQHLARKKAQGLRRVTVWVYEGQQAEITKKGKELRQDVEDMLTLKVT